MSKTNKIKPEISESILEEIEVSPREYAEGIPVKTLVKILRTLSSIYYNTGKSVVSDNTYDTMKDVLEERDVENEFLKEIGAPVSKLAVKLPYPMGSLTKIKPENDTLDAWVKKYKGPYVLSDKLDGTSAQFYKESETVYKLYSRGNGTEGQDISHLIKYVVPASVKTADIPVGTSVRGELLISKEDFKKISNKMKNARNATSGLVNSKTIDKTIAALCQFVAYAVLHPPMTQLDQMKFLQKLGFNVVHYKVVKELSNETLSEYLKSRRTESKFEVDGIVVADSSKVYKHEAGNPSHAFAFKTVLDDQVAQTKVVKIDWSATMDGYLKPVIEIEPVDLSGVTITHATGFNAKYVVDNKLGPGAIVKIVRSGDVIPHILEIIKPAKEAQMPEDMEYEWNATGVDIVLKDLYGSQHDAVTIKLISHFFKKLGVKFISEGIVTKLVNAGYKSIPAILSADEDDLAQINGIGKKTVDKFFTNVKEALKKTDLATFIAATHVLGRGISTKKLDELIARYPNLMNETWNKKTFKEKIIEVEGFSDITADKIIENFKAFKELFDQINKIIDISHLSKVHEDVPAAAAQCAELEGKTIVFTGFRDKDLEKMVKICKGKVTTSVSKNTSMVVTNDPTSGSSKLLEAAKLKVKIMTKDDFINKYKLDKPAKAIL